MQASKDQIRANDTAQSPPARAPRVLHLVSSPLSTLLMRGQLRYLSEKGFEVLLASAPGPQLQDVSKADQVQAIEVKIDREMSPFKDILALWRLFRLMRRLKPDITNVSTPKAGLLGGLAARIAGVPCRIYTLRGLRWETTSGLKRALLKLTEWIACRCAHRVICVSSGVRENLVAEHASFRQHTIVFGSGSSNGVDIRRFVPCWQNQADAAALRARLGIPPDALVIGFAGRLTRDKGICELYEAYTKLRRQFPLLRLLVAGDFEAGDPVPATVRRSIESDSSVVRSGFVVDIADFYRVMDVFVLPTYREGFPTAVLEAQASGIPVVTTTATGAIESVVNGTTGLVVPVADVEALTSAIGVLLADAPLRSRMGHAGRDWVVKHFRSEVIWEALAEEYSQLLLAKGLAVTLQGMAPTKIANSFRREFQ